MFNALQQPGFIDDLVEDLNGEWVRRSPFVWCERIENNTGSPFNRQERIKGSDFVAELLKTVDRAKDDPELQERLNSSLSELYQHRQYRKYLSGDGFDEDDFAALVDEAEAIVVDQLAGNDV